MAAVPNGSVGFYFHNMEKYLLIISTRIMATEAIDHTDRLV